MYDRQTDTLWHQLWGTPAFGPLVGSGIELERLPVTLTTWETWYAENPDTRVMAFETGFSRNYDVGAAYQEYFNSPDTMFPVWRRNDLLPTKSWVFTQLIDGQPKAYPLSALQEAFVVNDTLGEQNLVVLNDAGGHGGVAYNRAGYTFSVISDGDTSRLVDERGVEWDVTLNGLISDEGDTLDRLPGHMAYWFGTASIR